MSIMTKEEIREEAECRFIKRLINDIYPNGFISIVSDTFDLWAVITKMLPRCKDDIMSRDGKVVIRPDSGNPADIICGNPYAVKDSPEYKGVVELLWDIFGGTTNHLGYKELDSHIGAIYGDAITRERATDILQRLKDKGFASNSIVFGIGSYTYQYNTRDTLGFALKSTYVKVNGKERQIFKDPTTDSGLKKSAKGLVVVLEDENGELYLKDELTLAERAEYEEKGLDQLEVIYEKGELVKFITLKEIREEIRK